MSIESSQLRALAKEKEDENWRFRNFLKTECTLEPKELDQKVFALTKAAWQGVDCTTCANCCRETATSVDEEELMRLAKRVGLDREAFLQRYLQVSKETGGKPWEIKALPCPFLENDRCSVYEDRPDDCKQYPFLYEPDFVFRTIGMISRTSTCPIVFDVMEELKQVVGFNGKS